LVTTLAGETETRRRRALADEQRPRIVEALRAAPDGLDVESLSHGLGLHANTIRWHLGVLRDAGVVESRPEAPTAPGRPRIRYTLSPGAPSGRDEYRLLALMLAGAVEADSQGAARAEAAGRAWGRQLVRRPLPPRPTDDEEAVGAVVDLLADQGFAPRADGGPIEMRRCPFHEPPE